MGEDLPVFGELEIALHQAIGELAGVDRERAHVAGHLLIGFIDAGSEHHLEIALAEFVGRAEDERHQVWRHGDGHR